MSCTMPNQTSVSVSYSCKRVSYEHLCAVWCWSVSTCVLLAFGYTYWCLQWYYWYSSMVNVTYRLTLVYVVCCMYLIQLTRCYVQSEYINMFECSSHVLASSFGWLVGWLVYTNTCEPAENQNQNQNQNQIQRSGCILHTKFATYIRRSRCLAQRMEINTTFCRGYTTHYPFGVCVTMTGWVTFAAY